MKKVIAIALSLTLAVGLLCGCGSSPASSAPAAANTEKTETTTPETTAANGETYKLSFTIHDPATSVKTQLYQDAADKVAEETNGAVEITIYSSGTLVAGTDVAEGLLAGTADMGWLFTPFFTNQFPLTEVVQLPLFGGDVYASSKTIRQLYEEYPEVQAELSNYKVLNVYTQPGNMIFTKGKEVHQASDLAGLNIRTSSNVGTTMMGSWGASAMSYGPGDVYEAMQKNVLDGFTFDYSGVKSFKLYEVCDYVTELEVMTGPFVTAMNLDTWNSLPAEYQEVIEKYFGWDLADAFIDVFMEDWVAGKDLCKENNVEIISLTDEERATFQDSADKFIEEWINTYTTDTFDAQAYLDHAREIYDENLSGSKLTDQYG